MYVNGKFLCDNCFEESTGQPCPHCGFDRKTYHAAAGTLPVGVVLHGKYQIGKVLGKGGFGVTYKAYDVKEQKLVALKEYYPNGIAYRDSGTTQVTVSDFSRTDDFQTGAEKFCAEAKTISRFNGNPSIVDVCDSFFDNGTAYFAMEYLDGMDLKHYIRTQGGRVKQEYVLRIAKAISDALLITHSMNVLHRDISPDNIYITNDGYIKLIDFGAARQVVSQKTSNMSVILKQGFAPLEQYQRKGNHGPWTDVYALGATLYYALTGHVADDATERLEKSDLGKAEDYGVDAGLWKVIEKCMAVKIEDRYQGMIDLKTDLNALGIEDQELEKPKDALARIKSAAAANKAADVAKNAAAGAVSQQPASGQPGASYQPSQQPASGQPATSYQPSQQPASGQPATSYQPLQQPASGQPATSYQPSQQPASGQPATSYQPSQQPASSQPGTSYQPTTSGQPSQQPMYQMPQANQEKNSKKAALIIGIAALAVIAIIGAIIGIVLNGRKGKDKPTDIVSADPVTPTSMPTQMPTQVPTQEPEDTPKPTLKPLPTTAPTDTPKPTPALYDVGSFNPMHANNIANNGNMIGGRDWKCWCDASGLHYQVSGGQETVLDPNTNITCINEVGELSYTEGGVHESFWYLIDGVVSFSFKDGDGTQHWNLTDLSGRKYEKMWVNNNGGFFVYAAGAEYCLAYWSVYDDWMESVTISYPEGVAISGNYIYYLKKDGKNTILYRQDMRKFGSDENEIITFYEKTINRIAAQDDYIYFAGQDTSAKQPCFGVIDADTGEGEFWNYIDYSETQYISSINVADGYVYFAISDSAEEEQAHVNYSRTSELWQDSGLYTYKLELAANPAVASWVGDMCLCPEKGKMAVNYSDERGDLYYREVDMP